MSLTASTHQEEARREKDAAVKKDHRTCLERKK
jgi:hypothetical protein